MIAFCFFLNIFFISLELSLLEYNFIKTKKIDRNLYQYLFIDFLHQFTIFINYGLQIFILFSIFIFTKKEVLILIIILNVIWLIVFISYLVFDDCIFLILSHKIVPLSSKYRFIDPSERISMMFDQKLYNSSKKKSNSTMNEAIFIQLIILVFINISISLIYG